MYMNVIKIEKFSTSNGHGLRNVIWVAGCKHHCKGCHNPESWNFDAGHSYTSDDYDLLVSEFRNINISDSLDGITLLGGEPFDNDNIGTSIELVKKFRDEFPNKTIWSWTGYTYESFNEKQLELFNLCDVVIDGEFYIDLLDLRLQYRGSSNQRVIDVNKTKLNNKLWNYLNDKEF